MRPTDLVVPIVAELAEREVVGVSVPEGAVDEDDDPPAGVGDVGLSWQSGVVAAVACQSPFTECASSSCSARVFLLRIAAMFLDRPGVGGGRPSLSQGARLAILKAYQPAVRHELVEPRGGAAALGP